MQRKKLLLLSLLCLTPANDVLALTVEDIDRECTKRAGNLTALREYAREIEGESITVTAKFTRLDTKGFSGHHAYFLTANSWRLVTRLPTEKQLEFRTGEEYTMTAKIGSALWRKGLDIADSRGTACSGDLRVKITQWP